MLSHYPNFSNIVKTQRNYVTVFYVVTFIYQDTEV